MVVTWDKYRELLFKKASNAKIPFWGAFELTPRCNFQCKMCYVCRPLGDREAMEKELTADQWIRLAEQARDAGVLYLNLTGGEVMARRDFEKIYTAIAEMGFNLTVLTNASLLDEQKAKLFARYMPSKVSVTLYGASAETYQKVTGCASGFERTIKAIDRLLADGIALEIKTTVVKANAAEFAQIEEIVSGRGAQFAVVDYIAPRREGDFSDPLGNRLEPDELALYEKQLDELNAQKHTNAAFRLRGAQADDDSYLAREICSQTERADPECAFHCYVGKCAFWVTWDGRLTPCGMLSRPEAFPLKEGFSAAWQRMNDEVLKIPSCHECKTCDIFDYCNCCPARLFAETGSFEKNAPYLCACTKERLKLKNGRKNGTVL